MVYRYIPMLKTKAGEASALFNLDPAAASRVFPLLHVTSTVSPSFSKQMGAAWAGKALGVDGSFNYTLTGSINAFTALVNSLRTIGVTVLPCVSQSDPAPYVNAAGALVDANGWVLKTSLANIVQSTSWAAVSSNPGQVDVVIDLKHVGSMDVGMMVGYVHNALYQAALALAPFRSVTLALAAAPKDAGSLVLGPNTVPRSDFAIWNGAVPSMPFQLDYGDYCTGHPDLTEPPGAAMAKATVSVRYTMDQSWLIIKGRSTSGPNGLPMTHQYGQHATALIADPGFGGVPSCWADGRVQAYAAAPGGSRQSWSEIAANRHISLVADRLP